MADIKELFTSLLCYTHRDGGQYIEQHGPIKAAADAVKIIQAHHIAADSRTKVLAEIFDEMDAVCEGHWPVKYVNTFDAIKSWQKKLSNL